MDLRGRAETYFSEYVRRLTFRIGSAYEVRNEWTHMRQAGWHRRNFLSRQRNLRGSFLFLCLFYSFIKPLQKCIYKCFWMIFVIGSLREGAPDGVGWRSMRAL